MGLHQHAPVEDLHQLAIGADLDAMADQVPGHRVQGLGHLDVVVAVDLRGGVDGQVVCLGGRREQMRRLLDPEVLSRAQSGGAMRAQPGGGHTPGHGPALGVVAVDEVLAVEERPAHVGNGPLHLRLVLGPAHPGGVDGKPPGGGVVGEGLVDAGLCRIGLVDDAGHVVGDDGSEHPAEESPGLLEASDDRLDGLGEGEPHEAVARQARGEDQGVADPTPAGLGVEEHAHAPEVDLELVSWVPVGHPDGDTPAPARTAQLGGEPGKGAHRDLETAAGQQVPDLGHGESLVLDPGADLVGLALESPPRGPVAVVAVGPDRLDHHGQEDVAQLFLPALPAQASGHRRLDVAPDRLAVDSREAFHPSEALAPQPEPEHFTYFEHRYLPESHRRSPIR